MLDSRAAINIISRALYNHLGLQMLSTIEYDIRLVKGLCSKLDRVIDNVSILVSIVAFKISFFMIL